MLPTLRIITSAVVLGFSYSAAQSPSYNASQVRWEWEPAWGPLEYDNDRSGYVNLSSGVDLWYATMGQPCDEHLPVLVLHGGTATSHSMYRQASFLAKTREVIVTDTRGEGRSPYSAFTDFHYDDFARDAIAVLDHLNISRVAVYGWSDGAMIGLNLAMNYSSRIDRVFAHGAQANFNQSIPGTKDPIINSATGSFTSNFDTKGTTVADDERAKQRLLKRQEGGSEYWCENISPLPERCADMYEAVFAMWASEPAWGPEALGKIQCPVWIVDGDHDAGIQRNQADALAAWIPYAGQLLLPQTGHWALLEDWKFFNFALEYFLDMGFDGQVPYY